MLVARHTPIHNRKTIAHLFVAGFNPLQQPASENPYQYRQSPKTTSTRFRRKPPRTTAERDRLSPRVAETDRPIESTIVLAQSDRPSDEVGVFGSRREQPRLFT